MSISYGICFHNKKQIQDNIHGGKNDTGDAIELYGAYHLIILDQPQRSDGTGYCRKYAEQR